MTEPDEVCRLAQNLARNCGYAVFPLGKNKRPTKPAPKEGEGGYKEASKDPDKIAWLWQHWPGVYIGVATGGISGVDLVDVDNGELPDDADPKKIATRDAAAWWWKDNHLRIPQTRAFESGHRGIHLIFRHAPGLRLSQNRVNQGVDVRADGGYWLFWFAAGRQCLDHSPLAEWPAWLLHAAMPPPEPVYQRTTYAQSDDISGIIAKLESANDGRHGLIYWCAHRLRERGYSQADAQELLVPAAGHTKKHEQKEDRRTIASAYRGGLG
jgi:hypothetical protein